MGDATLSLSTNAFAPDRLDACLQFAAALGLAGVEVGPRHGEGLHESPDAFEEARTAFRRLGIRPLSVHAYGKRTAYPLGDVCAFAERLGAGLVVVHCRHEALVEEFEAQVAHLTKWHDWCRERDMTLTVENSSIQPLEPFVRLFEAVPDLKLTLDVKHAYKPEKLGLTHVDYLRELGDRCANFHISGIDRSREPLGDGCPPGNDHVDWAALAADLARRRYAGLITIELNLPTYLSLEEQEAAYGDLPPADDALPTISHRLAKHAVGFFHRVLAPVVRG